jgi:FMN reductase (NADPH)
MNSNSPQSVEAVRNFFSSHWTVRKYKKFKMPEEHLDTILFAAQRAPTDATAQMYSFIRLTDPLLRKDIANLSNNSHIETASEAFIVCADLHRLEEILKTKDYEFGHFPSIAVHFAIGDAVLAGQNMLLAAEMLGYQGCWIGGVMNALIEISQRVQLPKKVFPFAALTLGVPDEPPLVRPRLPRSHIVHDNIYETPSPYALEEGIQGMSAISSRGDWPLTLSRYFAKGGTMEMREKVLSDFLKACLT